MFIRKKSFYQKKAFYGIVAAVIVFGIFINQIPGNTGGENIDAGTNVENTADETPDIADSAANDALPERLGPPEDDRAAGLSQPSGYYLVKEVNGIIKVFYYDAQGRETIIQNTNILYSLISETDQNLFSQGVILDTEDELMNLLQDFES